MKVASTIDPCLFATTEVGKRISIPDYQVRVLANLK
jgi:hypothetical protein